MGVNGEAQLDNIVWYALTTRQQQFAVGSGAARRYDPEVSIFGALEDVHSGAWDDLAASCRPGTVVVLVREEYPELPDGWTEVDRGPALQMVLEGPPPDLAAPAGLRALGAADVQSMTALIDLTRPGPFALRTVELGGFVGAFDGDQLVAMAGRRFEVDGFVEVSGVCTHPDAQRRGLGAAVTAHVARAIVEGGDRAMLHVAAHNVTAQRVYDQLGFTVRRTLKVLAARTPT